MQDHFATAVKLPRNIWLTDRVLTSELLPNILSFGVIEWEKLAGCIGGRETRHTRSSSCGS